MRKLQETPHGRKLLTPLQMSEFTTKTPQHLTTLSVSLRIVRFLFPEWQIFFSLWMQTDPKTAVYFTAATHSSSLTEVPLVDGMNERVSCDLVFKYVSFSVLQMSHIPDWLNRESLIKHQVCFSRTSCNDLITEVNKSSAMILARWLSCVTSRSLCHGIAIIRIDLRCASFILGIFFNRLISSLRPRKELEIELVV